MTQNEMILNHLKTDGKITQLEALQEYGIMRLASRISDLKRRGVPIKSKIKTAKNRYGESVHFAEYSISEVTNGTKTKNQPL